MSEIFETNVSNSNTYKNLVHLQNLLLQQQKKYTKGKLLCDAVSDCASTSDLPLQLRDTLSRIVLESSCSQVLSLESQGSGPDCSTLLGPLSPETPISYIDIHFLEPAVIAVLRKKHSRIHEEFKMITGQEIQSVVFDAPGLYLTHSDSVLLNRRNQLSEIQEKYRENLLKQQEILEKMTKLRVEVVPKLTEKKLKHYQIQTRMNELRLRIVNQKTRVDIFVETGNSLDAYKQLMADIEKEQEDCQQEIADLEALKDKYAEVSSKHFQELLNAYKQYKMSVEKKKSWYNNLKTLA